MQIEGRDEQRHQVVKFGELEQGVVFRYQSEDYGADIWIRTGNAHATALGTPEAKDTTYKAGHLDVNVPSSRECIPLIQTWEASYKDTPAE